MSIYAVLSSLSSSQQRLILFSSQIRRIQFASNNNGSSNSGTNNHHWNKLIDLKHSLLANNICLIHHNHIRLVSILRQSGHFIQHNCANRMTRMKLNIVAINTDLAIETNTDRSLSIIDHCRISYPNSSQLLAQFTLQLHGMNALNIIKQTELKIKCCIHSRLISIANSRINGWFLHRFLRRLYWILRSNG